MWEKNISRNQVIRAAKLANANNFIMKKKSKYNTIIGDRGVMLSGGESKELQ